MQYQLALSTKPAPSVSTSRWLVACSLLLFLLTITALTNQQLKNEKSQAIAAAIRQNENRVDGYYKYILRTFDLAEAEISAAVSSEETGLSRIGRPTRAPDTKGVPGLIGIAVQKRDSSPSDGRVSGKLPSLPVEELDRADSVAGLSLSKPIRLSTGQDLMGISKRTRSNDGNVRYITLWVEPRVFTDYAESVLFDPTDLISVIGLDGISRVRRTGQIKSVGEDLRGTLVMNRQAISPNGTYIGPSSIDGIPRIFSHRRLPAEALFVTSGMSITSALAQYNQHVGMYLMYLVLGAISSLAAAIAILRGIGERQQQISTLSLLNDQLNEAQKVGQMGSWHYDVLRDELTISDNLCAMYQRPSDHGDRRLKAETRFVGTNEQERISRALEKICARGEPIDYLLDVVMPDGLKTMRRFVAMPIYDQDRNIIGVRGTDQDVSATRRVEALETKIANLAQIDAMNAIAATLAHELTQPLSAMANYASAAAHLLAETRAPTVVRAKRLIARAISQIHHCSDIIKAARELVERERSVIQTSSLKSILGASLEILGGTDGYDPSWFVTKLDPKADCVLGRPSQINQVILNLIRNGIQAVPECRLPIISISTSVAKDGRNVVAISDNGVGFDGLESDPFSALISSKKGGLGIGLSLCRTIVEGHGGKIWIASSNELGTTIEFSLRRATQ